MSEESK